MASRGGQETLENEGETVKSSHQAWEGFILACLTLLTTCSDATTTMKPRENIMTVTGCSWKVASDSEALTPPFMIFFDIVTLLG